MPHMSLLGLQREPAVCGLTLMQKLILGRGAEVQLVSSPEHPYSWS